MAGDLAEDILPSDLALPAGDYLLAFTGHLGMMRPAFTAHEHSLNLQQMTAQAVQLHQQGREGEAERLYRQILAAAPEDFTANYMLGVIRFQRGQKDEAMRLFAIAVRINPAPSPLIFYGLLLQEAKRYEEALAAFDRALNVSPDLVEALVNRGNVLCSLSRFAEALASYDRALALKPDFALAHYNRGNALRDLNRPQDALSSFNRALIVQPDYVDAWVNRGSTERDLKHYDAALKSFDRALAQQPQNASALYNRGTTLRDLGRMEDALAAFDRALPLMPGFPALLNNRATVLQALKRHEEALADFDRALVLEPGHADTLSNRGNLLREMKRREEALASLNQALAIAPGHTDALNNRGTVLREMARPGDALADFERALGITPGNPRLLCNRALVLRDLQRHDEALADLDKALAAEPGHAVTHYNRGLTLMALGRYGEALDCHGWALAIDPGLTDAMVGRADTLREMSRFEEALESYDRALAFTPDHAGALNNRASVLQALRRNDEALASYDLALRASPRFVDALYNRGNLLWLKYQRFEEARRDLEQVALLEPDYDYLRGDLLHLKMQAGDWEDFAEECAAMDEGVRAGERIIRPFVYQAISQSPADLQKASMIYASDRFPPRGAMGFGGGEDSKIKIGYVSADFREQATAFLMAGLYEYHDKTRFEIIAFDTGWNDHGPTRQRLEAAFDKFIDISRLSDRDAAERVRAEGIDILVNLNGYFGTERMGVFAYRPAPVQVNYLGFPATLGAPYMDYILADRVVIPEAERQFYSEQVVWLPDSYQVNDSKRAIAAEAPGRVAAGLPAEGFVFCNFNNNYKLTPGMFALWMDILRQVPDSVLWLLESNRSFPEKLRAEAKRQGIASERIIFARPLKPADHLARMRLADLFLDCLPYNAHTTASDALWAGLPLITCCGTAFPGRVATSLLLAVGLPELVTETMADYSTLALRLAQDPARLTAIREKLGAARERMPLFDTAGFCRHLEGAYATMIEISRRGERARSFAVPKAG